MHNCSSWNSVIFFFSLDYFSPSLLPPSEHSSFPLSLPSSSKAEAFALLLAGTWESSWVFVFGVSTGNQQCILLPTALQLSQMIECISAEWQTVAYASRTNKPVRTIISLRGDLTDIAIQICKNIHSCRKVYQKKMRTLLGYFGVEVYLMATLWEPFPGKSKRIFGFH